MCTLDIKIKEMKEYLRIMDINKIKKLKLNTKYDFLDLENYNLLDEYKYYIRLIEKLKRYIKSNEDKYIIVDIEEDKNKFIVVILTTIDFNSKYIGIPIDITLLTGTLNETYMDCTYYDINKYAMLYINNFKSRISGRGYGSILLTKLDGKVKEVNKVLYNNNLKEIKLIEGVITPDKNIISENSLVKLYKKYGFKVGKYNRAYKNIGGKKYMSTLKVGLIQHKAKANDIDENLELGLKYIKLAKEKGADIVLFPEMWSNGYEPPFEGAFDNSRDINFEKERNDWLENALDEDSKYVCEFQNISKELNISIVITYLSKGKKAPQNTALVIDNKGSIAMKYSKVHTCDFSLEGLLESGSDFKVCDINGVKIGVMICYDREFPESARILMLKGSEIILVPNACDINPARLNQLSTRAFENMVGVAMANYPKESWGQSCAFSPIVFDESGYVDNKIFIADDKEEDIFIVEFDMDKIRKYREEETWGNAYRKVNAYSDLLEKEVKEPFIRK